MRISQPIEKPDGAAPVNPVSDKGEAQKKTRQAQPAPPPPPLIEELPQLPETD